MNPLRVQDSIIVVFLLNVKNLHSFRMVFVDIHGKKRKPQMGFLLGNSENAVIDNHEDDV